MNELEQAIRFKTHLHHFTSAMTFRPVCVYCGMTADEYVILTRPVVCVKSPIAACLPKTKSNETKERMLVLKETT